MGINVHYYYLLYFSPILFMRVIFFETNQQKIITSSFSDIE